MAAAAGIPLAPPLLDRFDEGFAVPFLTALPDFTFPARRDSQHAVSLRQWRVAESAELGLARRPGDARLHAALAELYRADVPPGDTGRARSTAEAERNEPPARLTRADLGWRSLVHALPELPPLVGATPRSALLEGQGLAVIRRERGRVYVALDYGESGGGHGHPDRLNLLLADGDTRWLDDVGTGSYVERTLHWYRSTLAHNAPLVDGRSQARVSGRLRAYEERDVAAWVDAEAAEIAPGVVARRAIVVLDGYVVDELTWTSEADATVDLPAHVDAEPPGARWVAAPAAGGGGLEDGFDFLTGAEHDDAGARGELRLHASRGGSGLDLWAHARPPAKLWRAVGPGAPGAEPARFIGLRQQGREGRLRLVWSIRGAVREVSADGEALVVALADGTRHRHERAGAGWRLTFVAGAARSTIDLVGARSRPDEPPATGEDVAPLQPVVLLRRLPAPVAAGSWLIDTDPGAHVARFALARRHYRRTEESWRDAGAPRASVAVGVDPTGLVVEADVRKAGPLTFAVAGAENQFDNEHPDVDGDGLQLYLAALWRAAGAPDGWRVVPVPGSTEARVAAVAGLAGSSPPPTARWSPTPHGYRVQVRVPLVVPVDGAPFRLDLAVNEKPPHRARRRGQLLLSASRGEFVYLQGDRVAPARWLPFRLDA
jgi:hypothetical protein